MTTVLTAHGPEDLLAAVPVVLGFRPSESLVMLTFGGRHTFHARVDLPGPDEPAEAVAELVDSLLAPARAQAVRRVAFVAYTADAPLAARIGARLRRRFTRAGITVIDVLRAHEGRWTCVPTTSGRRERPSQPYDDLTHPFAAQAVLDGRVTRASRDDLRTGLAADAAQRRRVLRAQLALPPPGPDEQAVVLDLVARCVRDARPPDDDEAARVLRAITDVDVRDAALFVVRRDTVDAHLELWSALLRRAPDAQVPDAAALTAFCAWRAGHGALAWCALDRCFEVEPAHRLGLALAECLVRAVPPAAWDDDGPPAAERPPPSWRRDRPDAESDTA